MSTARTLVIFFCGVCVAGALYGEATDYDMVTEAQATRWVERAKKNGRANVPASKEAVPTKETAIALAIAVWVPIYGKEHIAKEAPYQAIRVDDCWFVTGSLPKGAIGGTAIAVIKNADGRFLLITHEQ